MTTIERMEEATKYGNSVILKASEQAGFLAAALIASISFWQSYDSVQLLDQIAFISLAVSIFMSIFTHFAIGKTYVTQMKKLSQGNSIENAFLINSGWVFGVLQIVFLIAGLSIIFFNILVA